MALEKLDGRTVRGARWRQGDPPSGKKLADGGGLFLLMKPNGSRLWRYKYRLDGKERIASLGGYPEIDLAEARVRHREARGLVKAGRDPVLEARRAREAELAESAPANTFKSVAEDWFTAKVADRSPSHQSRTRGILKNYLYPEIADLAIEAIEPPTALAALRKIEAAGRLQTARKARQIMNGVYRFAIAAGLAKYNPVADLTGAMQEVRARHFAAITDPRDVGPLMVAIDTYDGSLVVRSALRLSALLFQRPGEMRTMRWSEIDIDGSLWTRPGSTMKTGTDHLVPLSRQAVDIIRELEPLTGRSEYVLPSQRGPFRPMSENTVRIALRTAGYDADTMTAHGFRAMARTILDEVLGYPVDWIEHQLAHAVRDANGRAYNRTRFLEQRAEMLQAWADYLDHLRDLAAAGEPITRDAGLKFAFHGGER